MNDSHDNIELWNSLLNRKGPTMNSASRIMNIEHWTWHITMNTEMGLDGSTGWIKLKNINQYRYKCFLWKVRGIMYLKANYYPFPFSFPFSFLNVSISRPAFKVPYVGKSLLNSVNILYTATIDTIRNWATLLKWWFIDL